MPEFQNPDNNPISERSEIKIGEWFSPLKEYSSTPYSNSRPDYLSKVFHTKIDSIGDCEIGLDWDFESRSQNTKGTSPVRVFGPLETKDVTIGEIQSLEAKYETRIMELWLLAKDNKFQGKSLPYAVECRLPDGSYVGSDLAPIVDEGTPMTYYWRDGNSDRAFTFGIPEIDTFIEDVQMRVVPKEIV